MFRTNSCLFLVACLAPRLAELVAAAPECVQPVWLGLQPSHAEGIQHVQQTLCPEYSRGLFGSTAAATPAATRTLTPPAACTCVHAAGMHVYVLHSVQHAALPAARSMFRPGAHGRCCERQTRCPTGATVLLRAGGAGVFCAFHLLHGSRMIQHGLCADDVVRHAKLH